jgi:uncharacterized protein (TIGR03085 family)
VPTAPIWAIPAVRERANLLEYLIHHEDVRRAQHGWEPRDLPADLQAAIWARLPLTARLAMRGLPRGVALVWPGHGRLLTARARRAGVAVTVTADPMELTLFASGRLGVARVDLDGEPEDVTAVLSSPIGL